MRNNDIARVMDAEPTRYVFGAAECALAVHLFFQHLDGGDFESLAAMFAPEGVWVRMGKPCIGREGILKALSLRPAGITTRHLVSNLTFRETEMNAFEARYIVTTYSGGATPESGPLPMSLPEAMFDGCDRLVLREGRLLFLSREARMIFKRQSL